MAVKRIAIEDRESWLSWRQGAVNASEVATACGLGAFGSLAELYAQKKGLCPPHDDNPLLRKGRWLEAAVFEALAEQRPHWQALRARIYLVDPDARLGATPDGFAADERGPGIVQAKVTAPGVFRRRWLTDETAAIADGDAEPPVYYVLQTLTEMMLADCAWGAIAVLVGDSWTATLRTFEVERNPELEAMIRANVAKFWSEYFDPAVMPDFVPQRDAALIRALFPSDDGSVIDLTRNNAVGAMVDHYSELQAAMKRVKTDSDTVKAELEATLQQHTYGQLADGRVLSWKQQHRRAYSVAAADYRVLRILKQMPARANEVDDE